MSKRPDYVAPTPAPVEYRPVELVGPVADWYREHGIEHYPNDRLPSKETGQPEVFERHPIGEIYFEGTRDAHTWRKLPTPGPRVIRPVTSKANATPAPPARPVEHEPAPAPHGGYVKGETLHTAKRYRPNEYEYQVWTLHYAGVKIGKWNLGIDAIREGWVRGGPGRALDAVVRNLRSDWWRITSPTPPVRGTA